MIKNTLLAVLALVAVVLLLVLYNLFQPGAPMRPRPSVAYSDFIHDVDARQVAEVIIDDTLLLGRMADGRAFQTYMPPDPTLTERLLGKGVHISVQGPEPVSGLHSLLNWFPAVIVLGLWFLFLRRVSRSIAALVKTVETLPAALAARVR